jgi:MinD-like ATPase involved in chromosome partitioning or flagellar assembly
MSAGLRTAAIAAGIFGSASALTYEMRSSDALLRAPLALCRRIGFVHLSGGAGCSSTAAYVASVLAHRRAGMVLGVDAAAGAGSRLGEPVGPVPGTMSWYAGVPAGAQPSTADQRALARTASEARTGLPLTPAGLYVLDLSRESRGQQGSATGRSNSTAGGSAPGANGYHGQASVNAWFGQVAPIARFYDVVCTDWGVRQRQVDLRQAAATCHVVCLVARADRHTAEAAAALVPALQQVEDQPPVVLALVDVGQTGDRAPQVIKDKLGVPVLTVPYDPRRAAARPVGSAQLSTHTRLAYTRLATELLRQAQRPAYNRLVAVEPQPANGSRQRTNGARP